LQTLPVQTMPCVHVVAPLQPDAAPQYVLLVVGSMHVPPHRIWPGRQMREQSPPTQVSPVAHRVPGEPPSAPHAPEAPQCWLLVAGSMHPPPQSTVPTGQKFVHPPAEQTESAEHWPPQWPQLALSVCKSLHSLPPSSLHRLNPPPQVILQVPPLHTVPETQALPHAPQLALSVSWSTHCDPQSVEPDPHPCLHTPATQDCPTVHAFPQVPQLLESVWVS
jgi:hypothetical protein